MKHEASSFRSKSHPAWLDKNLFPFQSRYLDVNGCHVHYVDEGAGPILLLLHGNPTWSFLYRDIIKELREHMRCIALDYQIGRASCRERV